MPTMGSMLRGGTYASGNGLLTEAPPNTGAGWYSLATGAWPGVHGSTNNTFHINGGNFANSTSAFAPGVLKAESIAQSAERGGLKVAQVEWAGGANATIAGPTIDFQTFASGRGVSTNFIGKAGEPLFDDAAFIAAFGLQFDTPAGYAGRDPFPAAAPTDATGWTGTLPNTYSPPKEMRLRVLDGAVDKYGLNAWIFDSSNDGKTNYDKVLFSRTKNAADAVATIGKGVFADVKVKVNVPGGALDGKTAGMLVRVEELTPDLSRVRLFHTSVSRAIATWPTWPGETGFTGDFAEYLAQTFPTSTAADFAILESGSPARTPTSTRASTGRPAIGRCSSTSCAPTIPTCSWPASRRPTSSSTSSSASSRRRCPTAPTTLRSTTSTSTACPTAGCSRASATSARPTWRPTRPWSSPGASPAGTR